MANPAKQKGTAWETELLPILRQMFGPQVERSPLRGVHDQGDFVGVPFLVEAKAHLKPSFLEWARVCRKKNPRWAVLYHGDRRKGDGPYALVPLAMFVEAFSERQAADL